MHSDNKPQPKNLGFQLTEDFVSAYANHVYFEPTEWDIKMLFGQLDTSVDPQVIRQHTGMTVAWKQAKIMSYFLNLQVAVHEMTHGKIKLSPTIFPPEPVEPTKEMLEAEPKSREIYEAIVKARNALLESL